MSVKHLQLFPFCCLRFDCLPFICSELFAHSVKEPRHCWGTCCKDNQVIATSYKLKVFNDTIYWKDTTAPWSCSWMGKLPGSAVFITSTPTRKREQKMYNHIYLIVISFSDMSWTPSSWQGLLAKIIGMECGQELGSCHPFQALWTYETSLFNEF